MCSAPVGALVSTIRRLGDAEAVAAYDALIDMSDAPDFKFLRMARDELVDDILRRVGQQHAVEVAHSLGLPLLDQPSSEAVEPQ